MTRGLVFLWLAPAAAALALGLTFASCDSGGEPPERLDSGDNDVLEDAITFSDTPLVDTISTEETTGDDAPDQSDAVIESGSSCSAATCDGGFACNATQTCTKCGAGGQIPCALNTCDDGGCWTGALCTQEGQTCGTLADAAVCMAGSCGTCGAAGAPCCGTTCTAPGTICQTGLCAQCGTFANQPCCAGSTCANPLACTDGICQ
jgi:hypothetical protein